MVSQYSRCSVLLFWAIFEPRRPGIVEVCRPKVCRLSQGYIIVRTTLLCTPLIGEMFEFHPQVYIFRAIWRQRNFVQMLSIYFIYKRLKDIHSVSECFTSEKTFFVLFITKLFPYNILPDTLCLFDVGPIIFQNAIHFWSLANILSYRLNRTLIL